MDSAVERKDQKGGGEGEESLAQGHPGHQIQKSAAGEGLDQNAKAAGQSQGQSADQKPAEKAVAQKTLGNPGGERSEERRVGKECL